jgi:hypothetical protein
MLQMRNIYETLILNTEGKISFGRISLSCQDNIEMHLKNMACKGMECVQVAEDGVQW